MDDPKLDQELVRLLGDRELQTFRDVVREVDGSWRASDDVQPATRVVRLGGQGRRAPRMRWWAMAASLLLLVSAGWWALAPTGPEIGDYLQPYEVSFATRGGASSGEPVGRVEAQRLYDAGEYDAAAEAFATLERREDVDFYRAVSLLLTGERASIVLAEELFAALASRQNHLLTEQARYYRALSLIQLDKPSEARQALAQIAPREFKYKEAQELIALIEVRE